MIFKIAYGSITFVKYFHLEVKTPIDLLDIVHEQYTLMQEVSDTGININTRQALAEILVGRGSPKDYDRASFEETITVASLICLADRKAHTPGRCNSCLLTKRTDYCPASPTSSNAKPIALTSVIARSKQDLIDRGILTWDNVIWGRS